MAKSIKKNSTIKTSFKSRARLLQLLGDQLIGTYQLAVLELVKNSYDADAEKVEVVIKNIDDPENTTIEVTDTGGVGMDLDIIQNIWLEIGSGHKEKKKLANVRTKKHKRLPLGEKGVGRFAIHKLGKKIQLITKTKTSPEISLSIDWSELEKCEYIDDTEVEITENATPLYFKKGMTGTRIIISDLKFKITRGIIRDLHRNIQSITSPFENKALKVDPKTPDFKVSLIAEDHPEWIENLHDMQDIIKEALFKFSFMIEGGKWDWRYEFNPSTALKKTHHIKPTKASDNNKNVEFMNAHRTLVKSNEKDFFDDLGTILGEIYVFDFDSEVRKFYNEFGVIKTFLKENKGIRVYRDGIRVYNYGEPYDDWLGMDHNRVQRMGVNLNRSITVGAVSLDLAATENLMEKTNREGFIENESYLKLKAVVQSAIGKFQALRKLDKTRLRALTNSEAESSIAEIKILIKELKKLTKEKECLEEATPIINRIEKNYNDMRYIMLKAGGAGLNMSIAFHEIYHSIKSTKKRIKETKDIPIVLRQLKRFELLLNTHASFLTKEKPQNTELSSILHGNIELADIRFDMHDIVYSCPVLNGEQPDYIVKAPVNLITSAINNVIDNSIYWLDQKWGKGKGKKHIYAGVSEEFDGNPAIIIADNGPGWRNIKPEEIVKPFLTTKPGGMGIGMYYANAVMETLGGELVLLTHKDIKLPKKIDGAVVALVFNGGAKCKK